MSVYRSRDCFVSPAALVLPMMAWFCALSGSGAAVGEDWFDAFAAGEEKATRLVLRAETVHFRSAEASLSSAAKEKIEQLLQGIRATSTVRLTVTGHTDSRGNERANYQLGHRRASRAAEEAVRWLGTHPRAFITTSSRGAESPRADNDTGEGRARNRRVELRLEILPTGLQPSEQAGAIQLEVSSGLGDGHVYEEGSEITYFCHVGEDAHLLLIYEDAAGNLLQVFPSEATTTSLVAGGSVVQVPDESDPFRFSVTPPFGAEALWAFAGTKPFPPLPGGAEGPCRRLCGDIAAVRRTLRVHAGRPGASYGEAVTRLTTIPRLPEGVPGEDAE